MVDTIIPTVKLLEGWKYIKDKKNLFDLLKSIIGATIMFAVLYFLCNRIESNAQKIIISMVAGSVVYAVTELILRHPSAMMFAGIIKNFQLKAGK